MSKRPNERKSEMDQGRAEAQKQREEPVTVLDLLQEGRLGPALDLLTMLSRDPRYQPQPGEAVSQKECPLMPPGTMVADFVCAWNAIRWTDMEALVATAALPWLRQVTGAGEQLRIAGHPTESQKVLGRSGDEERGRPVAVDLGFQPIPSANIPAALAALWRAMVALPAGHPALRSLAKCEAANPDDAVPRLKMCAAALRLMHLNASAEHVEKAAELLTGGAE